MRFLSGIGRPRSASGGGTGRLNRAANSFWPKYQETRAACAALKVSLSRVDGIETRVTAVARLCKGLATDLAPPWGAAYYRRPVNEIRDVGRQLPARPVGSRHSRRR